MQEIDGNFQCHPAGHYPSTLAPLVKLGWTASLAVVIERLAPASP
jgi:hypothetical protein